MKTLSPEGIAFSEWFRKELTRREMSQAAFARRSGFSSGVVNGWYHGRRVPEPASIDRIADVLMVNLDEVLAKAGHRPPVFEVDPNSPEGQLLPIIRRIAWDQRSIESFKKQLEFQAIQWPAKRDE